MEQTANRKEMLRSKWGEKLFVWSIASGDVRGVVVFRTCIVTPHRSYIHFPEVPGVVPWPGQAYADLPLCDVSAEFFEEHPSAKWLIVALITTGIGELREKSVKIVAWGE
jgi:hypothetical protein